jgi:type 1 glutamine amidotransferase
MMWRMWMLALAVGLAGSLAVAGTAAAQDPPKVLVFSKTAGFRHDSIPTAITAIQQLGATNGFAVDATEDAAQFNTANLAQYEAVVWLSTTGDVLNAAQEAAFEGYIEAGGGYAGIHAAADTEYGWAWYGGLVGAYFQSHPSNQQATVRVTDPEHPSTRDVPAEWSRLDEWYNYRSSPRPRVHVLAELDETSYDPGTGAMGADHPIAWCHAYDGGRSWYTGMGHTTGSWGEPDFRDHVLGGIRYAAGIEPADCAPPAPCAGGPDDEFEGDTLECPWSTIVRENPDRYEVRDGALRITTANGDLYGAGGNVENIVLQPAPSGGWEAATELTIDAEGGSEQGGVTLYSGDDDYAKVALLGRGGARWIEFLFEEGAQPRFDSTLDRTPDLPADFPDTVELKLTRDADGTLTAAYSTDGAAWTPVGRPAETGGFAAPKVGLFAQTNDDAFVTEAAFDWFHLEDATGEDTTPPTLRTEVDGLPTSDGDYLHEATVAISASDFGSGVATVEYALGDGAWQPYAAPVELGAGEHTVRARATDQAGNPATTTTTVTVVGDLGCAPAEPAGPRYVPIFDGTVSSLEGWKMAGPGGFDANADCTIDAWGGMGLLWHAAQELDSAYTLRAEWKIYADDDNSGMFIGFPDPGDDPWLPVGQGYEIQIDPTDEPVRTTGAVYSFQAPDEAARAAALRPHGEWNVMEVSVDGTLITVRLNGTVINSYDSPHPERSPMTGFVGIQNDGAGRDVTYRSVQLRDDRPDTTAPVVEASLHGTGPVTVTLDAADEAGGSGLASVEYALDGGAWTAYDGPFAVSAAGAHRVDYRATDEAGNVSEVGTVEFTIEAPGTQAPPQGSPPPAHDPPPPAPPTVDQPAVYRVTGARRLSTRRFARRGLPVTLTASEASQGTARVLVTRRAARRLGLRSRVLASRTVRFPGAGTKTVRIRPSRAVARRLGRVKATLELRLRDAAGNARTVRRTIVLS